jgi:peroxiredoxin
VTTTDPTLAEQVATLEAGLAAQAPAEVLAPFAAEQAALEAAGLPEGIPAPGTPMPDGKLVDVHGRATTLEQARGGQPAVVVFYRGAWCPYCNLTLRTYERQLVAPLAANGVALIAISPQTPDGSLSMQETNELSYTVLSDPGNQIAGQLGILTATSDDARASQAALGIDVAGGNADGTDTVPMPTVVIVDADGTIRWIDVHPNYARRTEPAEILEAVSLIGRI